jgi:hypothetical protein
MQSSRKCGMEQIVSARKAAAYSSFGPCHKKGQPVETAALVHAQWCAWQSLATMKTYFRPAM